jgi:hypothetical protein
MANSRKQVHDDGLGEGGRLLEGSVAMDGINPTLAFAVLFLGLSGNAREAPDDPATKAEFEAEVSCSVLMSAIDPPQSPAIETWAEAFWNSAADPGGPEVMESKWTDSDLLEFEDPEPTTDLASALLDGGSDPIVRQAVPVSASLLAASAPGDPCAPER